MKSVVKTGSEEVLPSTHSLDEESFEVKDSAGEEVGVCGSGVTCVVRLLEVVIVLLEGCREKLKESQKRKIVFQLAELLPILTDYFQVLYVAVHCTCRCILSIDNTVTYAIKQKFTMLNTIL